MSEELSERHNTGKTRWSLINFKSLLPMIEVLEFGAKKYSKDNWKKGFKRDEVLESLMRHTTALLDGQENDEESGMSHIGHIMCNCMFYSYHYVVGKTTVKYPQYIMYDKFDKEYLHRNNINEEWFIGTALLEDKLNERFEKIEDTDTVTIWKRK